MKILFYIARCQWKTGWIPVHGSAQTDYIYDEPGATKNEDIMSVYWYTYNW